MAQQHTAVVHKLQGQLTAARKHAAASAPPQHATDADAPSRLVEAQAAQAGLREQLEAAQAAHAHELVEAQRQRAVDAEAARAALAEAEAEVEASQEELAAEARHAREELAAVRQRARQMVREKDDEVARLRGLLRGDTDGGVVAGAADGEPPTTPAPRADAGAVGGGGGGGGGGASVPPWAITTSSAPGTATAADALLMSARTQAVRDAELVRLRQHGEALQAALDQARGAASREKAKVADLRRQVRRGEAAAAPEFLKEVVFKYALGGDAAHATLFPLVASVFQFSPSELEQVDAARRQEGASSFLSSFIFAPAADGQGFDDAASATPVRSATAAATPAAADDGESAEELRRKVARLKRLLRAAGVALASKAAESG